MTLSFFKLRSQRKKLLSAVKNASMIYKMQCDLVSEEKGALLLNDIAAARTLAKKSKSIDELAAAEERLSLAVGPDSPWHPLYKNSFAENFEVIVVAIAVAMAFRCYFFQPFKIPTGSMQPTLYGIHVDDDATPTVWDKTPLKFLKWAVTGDWYKEIRVKQGGIVKYMPETYKPGYITLSVAGELYHVPQDAVIKNGEIDLSAMPNIRKDGSIRSGEILWAGVIKSGDHVFVNRMAWNFSRPKRGDVMVFSTSGIPGLPQGTHYIKRMSGMPGEKVSINPPNLIINGKEMHEPYTIERIAAKERLSDKEQYAGYQTISAYMQTEAEVPLFSPNDVVTLADDEYYALGDNTGNSRDSRFWGPVPEEKLLGPAAFIYWPFTRFRIID